MWNVLNTQRRRYSCLLWVSLTQQGACRSEVLLTSRIRQHYESTSWFVPFPKILACLWRRLTRGADRCRQRKRKIIQVCPVLKVVWRSWGLPLTSYPSPLSPPSVYHPTPLSWGWSKSWGLSPPPWAPLTLSPEYVCPRNTRTEMSLAALRAAPVSHVEYAPHAVLGLKNAARSINVRKKDEIDIHIDERMPCSG